MPLAVQSLLQIRLDMRLIAGGVGNSKEMMSGRQSPAKDHERANPVRRRSTAELLQVRYAYFPLCMLLQALEEDVQESEGSASRIGSLLCPKSEFFENVARLQG